MAFPKSTIHSLCLGLVLFCCGMNHAQTAGGSLTITGKNISLLEVMAQITEQSGYHFTYNPDAIDTKQKLNLNIRKKSLQKCLKILSSETGSSFYILGKQIAIKPPDAEEKRFTISGFLADSETGESLIGAAIGIPGQAIGTFSNEFGFFSLSLKEGIHKLVCFHYGFKKMEFTIRLNRNISKNLHLKPLSFELPIVEIAPPLEDILEKKQLGALELSPKELNRLPELAGEPGIVNSLQSLPGIKTQSDGSAYFFARGGTRDQNVIFVDDAPIFNPSHLLGFYSVFIPDFAKSISVYTSNMPANMGDRLSSIVSIRSKDGNLKKGGFSGAINPFVYRLSLETPIKKDKSSLFLTLRRSNIRWIYRGVNPDYDTYFQDFQLKWNRKLNDKNRIFFTGIFGTDFLGNVNQAATNAVGITWANSSTTFRWNHLFGPKLFSNTTIHTGSYTTRGLFRPNYWKADLGMFSLKTDFTYYPMPQFTAKFGYERQWYFTNPGQLTQDSSLEVFPNFKSEYSQKSVLYFQGDWDISPRIKLEGGWRALGWANLGPNTYYTYDTQYNLVDTIRAARGPYHRYFNLDPRLGIRYKLSKSSIVKVGFGQYHQYLQMISNSISPFTTLEQWLPASPNIRPQKAQQWSLSYLNYLESQKMEISAAIYHKRLFNQIDFEGNVQTYLNPFLEGELRFGDIRAYGAEIWVKKAWQRWDGAISYNYSRAWQQTKGINNGNVYPALQDRPHDFSLVLHYLSPKQREWSFYWISYSGSPFTSPTGFFQFNQQPVPIYGERHNDRLPAYHRVDISYKIKLRYNKDKRFKHNLTFSVNNVLGHRNLFAVKFNKTDRFNPPFFVKSNVFDERRLGETQLYLVRFFPSLTYRFSL